jgi:hypothetical protein
MTDDMNPTAAPVDPTEETTEEAPMVMEPIAAPEEPAAEAPAEEAPAAPVEETPTE